MSIKTISSNVIALLLCIVIILLMALCVQYRNSYVGFTAINEPNSMDTSINTNKYYNKHEELLSFLTMDSLGKCEDIFESGDKRKDYEAIIDPYYKLVKSHDQEINKIAIEKKIKFKQCITGYSAIFPEESYVMISLARLPFVKTICETGFNGGHSALLWLTENPQAKVYVFDMGEFPCSKPMANHLAVTYPGRLTVTWGNSKKTLPEFIEKNPDVKCDLLIIDGGHTYDVAQADRINFRRMIRGPDNIIFLDNYPDRHFAKKNLGRAWEEALRREEILEYFRCHYKEFNQGFSFGKFLFKEE